MSPLSWPAAQYDCQQLAAVQLSLRLADLHGGLFCQPLAGWLILCAPGGVSLGGLIWGSSRW